MRALILADIDDLHWRHGPRHADLIVALGDVADSVILEAAEECRASSVFAIKGNHDRSTTFPSGITDLHLKVVEWRGLTFGGFQGCWKFKPRGHFLYEQSEVVSLLAAFAAVDVFVSHAAPVLHARDTDVHAGFSAFDRYIGVHQPRWFLHGHQHVRRTTTVGRTTLRGVYGYEVIELA